MKRILEYGRNHKGITLVMMAIMLALLLVFLSLAVDIAFMYFEKNQLQVAADAAALAGAAVISDPNDLVQTSARNTAIEFAAKNKTAGAGTTVQLISDNTNSNPILSNSNDITVGHWDGAQYNRGVTPVNALEVVPKRSAGLSGSRGPIRVFLGQIFKFFGSDWSFMSAKSLAIATKPPRASAYISLCTEACTGCTYDPNNPTAPPCSLVPPRVLEIKNCTPGEGDCPTAIAWTSLLNPITSANQLDPLICTTTPYVDICANPIYMTGGEVTDALRNFEANMYDPGIDSESKICRSSSGTVGKCSKVVGLVQSWEIIVPVSILCPPRAQGGKIEPKATFGTAKIRVTTVCETGGSEQACKAYGGRPCDSLRPCKPPNNACNPYGNHKIVIDQLQCIRCADADEQLGLKPVLVR